MMLKTAFCGCCSLRTGSIVLGVLWLLTDLGQIIAYSTDLSGADKTSKEAGRMWIAGNEAAAATAWHVSVYGTFASNALASGYETVSYQFYTHGHRLGSFIGLCISLLHLLGNVLLLLGADKGKAQWVKYAVMNHFVSLVLAVIAVIALSIFYSLAFLFFAGVIVTATAGYCWLVIYSFYWQLIEVAMTETQAQLETSALTKPTDYSTGLIDEEKNSSSSLAY